MKTVRSEEFGVRRRKLPAPNSQLRTTYWPKVKLLCEQARHFYERDWMLGTSGNLSVKVSDRPLVVAVTASGKDKGSLTARDIVLVDQHGQLLREHSHRRDVAKPSAETSIHLALYQLLPDCGAVFHVHTLYSTALTSRLPDGAALHRFPVERLEMLKGFDLWEEYPQAELPVFPNWLDVSRVADDVRKYFAQPRRVPAFLVSHHGLTAWGVDAAAAEKHTELAEFICRYLWTVGAQPAAA